VKVAIAYDCLYPFTIGGAEKWYRALAERLARRHRVSVLTRRQWSDAHPPELAPNLDLVEVSGPASLYGANGRRRIAPTLAYARGLFAHLVRHPHRYDVVHVASFPFFSVIAARAAQALGGPPCVVDWLEVWSREGWRAYLGGARGEIGAAVQQLCVRLSDTALVHSELHARRLEAAGCTPAPMVLPGLYEGPLEVTADESARAPLVIFAGRHISEKGVAAIPAAIAIARRRVPDLEALFFGDGPERPAVEREIERLHLQGVVRCEGVAAEDRVRAALGRAMGLVLPSTREGYGLVIVEAAAHGTPSIMLRARESAAHELIEPGENGLVIESATPEALAAALVDLHERGDAIAASTARWFRRHAARLSIESSVAALESVYRRKAASSPSGSSSRLMRRCI
jgi:glycosyltransferase involved in cell wall biosynthesis